VNRARKSQLGRITFGLENRRESSQRFLMMTYALRTTVSYFKNGSVHCHTVKIPLKFAKLILYNYIFCIFYLFLAMVHLYLSGNTVYGRNMQIFLAVPLRSGI
jgi:hypothetical protein